MLDNMSLGHGLFPSFSRLPPFLSHREVTGLEGKVISEDSSEYDLGGGKTSMGIRTIPVQEHSSG